MKAADLMFSGREFQRKGESYSGKTLQPWKHIYGSSDVLYTYIC